MSDLIEKKKNWSLVLHLIGVLIIVWLIGFGPMLWLESIIFQPLAKLSGDLQGPIVAAAFLGLSAVSLMICSFLVYIISWKVGGWLLFYSAIASLATGLGSLLAAITESYLNDWASLVFGLAFFGGYFCSGAIIKSLTCQLVEGQAWKRKSLTIASVGAYFLTFLILVIARMYLPY